MKKRWLLAVVLVIGCLIAAILTQLKDSPSYEDTLSDGTVVRLVKVGVGMLTYDSYSPLKAAIAGSVPNWFQWHLGVRHRVTISGEPDALTMLFRLRSNDGQPQREPGQFLSRIEFIESTGFVFRIGVSGHSSAADIMHVSEGPFPRRDPTLHMRLYENETDRLMFDLHIPNPGYKPEFDEWKPEPVPATQTVEPLTVTLKHGLEDIPTEYLRDEDIEITSTDPRWTNTRPQRQHWTTDATGGKANGLTGLSPFEPAWKLHVRVHRNEAAEFSPNEVWRTRLIRLPAPLTAERLNLRGMAGGYEFSTGYVTSAGETRDDGTTLTVMPGAGGNSSSSGTRNGKAYTTVDSLLPFFQLSHSALDEETALIIAVKDQDGRELTNDRSSGTVYHSGAIRSRRIQFQPLPDTTEIQLEVIVNKGRTFEFLVAPRKPDAANPSPPEGGTTNTL